MDREKLLMLAIQEERKRVRRKINFLMKKREINAVAEIIKTDSKYALVKSEMMECLKIIAQNFYALGQQKASVEVKDVRFESQEAKKLDEEVQNLIALFEKE